MADTYSVLCTTSALTGSTADRTKTDTATGSLTEEFWATVSLEPAASDTVLKLNLLTDPAILVVYGGTGCSFKLDSSGTDAISCDPIAVVSNEGDGLGIDEILLSNSDGQSHSVTIVAFE